MKLNSQATELATETLRSAPQPDLGKLCPLTRKPGILLKTREASELAESYSTYLDMPLPSNLRERYFSHSVTEYYCPTSGLRWYSPTLMGESDFYEFLQKSSWYYETQSWDKAQAIQLLTSISSRRFVDVGCGAGMLLELAAKKGMAGFGIENNKVAIREGTEKGLQIFPPDNLHDTPQLADTVVTLQTLEHVHDPAGWLRSYLEQFGARYAIVAVPCHDTMLGMSADPLSWPPHHATLWSGRALRVLARSIGFRVLSLEYEPNSWQRFSIVRERELRTPSVNTFPQLPPAGFGFRLFKALKFLRVNWARRAHTAIALMQRL